MTKKDLANSLCKQIPETQNRDICTAASPGSFADTKSQQPFRDRSHTTLFFPTHSLKARAPLLWATFVFDVWPAKPSVK